MCVSVTRGLPNFLSAAAQGLVVGKVAIIRFHDKHWTALSERARSADSSNWLRSISLRPATFPRSFQPDGKSNRSEVARILAAPRGTLLPVRLCVLFFPDPPGREQGAGQHVLGLLCQANVGHSHLSPSARDG